MRKAVEMNAKDGKTEKLENKNSSEKDFFRGIQLPPLLLLLLLLLIIIILIIIIIVIIIIIM